MLLRSFLHQIEELFLWHPLIDNHHTLRFLGFCNLIFPCYYCSFPVMNYHTRYVVEMWYLCDVLFSIEICITTVILIYALLHVHTLWLSLLLYNGRFTRPLLFLYSYLQFRFLNLMIFGFNRFVNSTLDVSYPAFLSIFAAPLISAFIHVPSDD